MVRCKYAQYFFWGANWVSGGEVIIGGGGEKIRWENLWDFLTFGGLVIRQEPESRSS